MNYKKQRELIDHHFCSKEGSISFLVNNIGIDVSRSGHFKVRPEENTPSCIINKDGSFHDFGSGEHYSDMVSLLFDGYRAFDSLPETMQWICEELGIRWEDNDE